MHRNRDLSIFLLSLSQKEEKYILSNTSCIKMNIIGMRVGVHVYFL